MNTYAQLAASLGTRDMRRVPSIRATLVFRRGDGSITVDYHGTAIVRAYPDGTFILNSGGFRTSTTKGCLNTFSPARVYQKAFRWFVVGLTDVPFIDGLHVDAQGAAVYV
jgi:hypothetical protein